MNQYFRFSGFSDEICADPAGQFRALSELGIRYFEPRLINGKNILSLSDDELDTLCEQMKAFHIKASSLGSPIGKYPITEPFDPQFETFRRAVEIAKRLGTNNIRMFSFFIPAGEDAAQYRTEVLSRLRRMIDYAKEQNVVLLHENEKGIYGDTFERCLDLMQELSCPNFYAVFDPANFIQVGSDTKKAFSALSDYIRYVHIKDATPDGRVVPAGHGVGHVGEILKQLMDRGFCGFLSIEPHLGEFSGFSSLEGDNKTVMNDLSDAGKFRLAYTCLTDELRSIGYNPDVVRMGIVGFGNMGSVHAKNIDNDCVPKMVLGAICDTDPEKRAAAEALYPVPVYADAGELFDSGTVDAVLIAVPHYDHTPLAVAAFRRGLHVLTEKPAGVYTKQVLEMNDAADRAGTTFGIMFNQRTNPLYQKLRDMVQSGELGHIKRISWTITDWYRPTAYHKSASWRSTWATEGGGTLVNQNPHQLDLWQWMFGMPDEIFADCSFGKYRDIEVDDEVTAYFRYKNGTTGTYITSIAEAPGTNRLEIACDMGRIVVEGGKMTFDRLSVAEPAFDRKNTESFPQIPHTTEVFDIHGSGTQHVGILNDYAEAVLNHTPLLAPGKEGINGVTIADAMYLSTFTHDWVDVANFPHDTYYQLLKEKIAASRGRK